MRTQTHALLTLAALAAVSGLGTTPALGQGFFRGRVQAQAQRRAAAPARPPYVVVDGPHTVRVYRMPANPRQRPSSYDYVEYDSRRPHWSFDNNLWMAHTN